MVFLTFGGAIAYFVITFIIYHLRRPRPDREVKHEVNIFGKHVTTITDRRTGLFEQQIHDSSGYRTYREKKCFNCGRHVSRSGNGTFRCCGRSWK